MLIANEKDLNGMKKVSEAVACALREMLDFVQPGMSTKQLDDYGARVLADFGAKSAPNQTYNFPGCTCISIENEFCHGIPSEKRILKEGDLINIDVSAELNGYWADNGASSILGRDIYQREHLVDASLNILKTAINNIKGGVKISEIGLMMETLAKKRGLKVIKNLGGHGVGRSLHEEPDEILNFKNVDDHRRFRKNSVVAVETFISTISTYAVELNDGWTMVGNKGGYMAQHEHTIIVTDGEPIILTEANGIFR